MSNPGILYVTMQPKPGLSIDQFHEWYNNEHGPNRLRLPRIFSNGHRYRATDGQKPEFLASYDVTSMSHLESESYLSLRANQTKREADTMAQVDVNRRFFDLVYTKQTADYRHVEDLPDTKIEGRALRAVEVIPSDAEGSWEQYQKWFIEEHVGMLSKVPGWLCARLFKTSGLQNASKPIYISLHEYAKDNGLGGEAHKASMNTPWRDEVMRSSIASQSKREYELFYVFTQAPRDLTSLSKLPSEAAFTSPDSMTATVPGPNTFLSSYITTPDSLNIPYRLEGNTAPGAPTVAFCNSLLTSLHMWDPFVEILKRERPELRLLRYDFRGRNSIPHPPVAATVDKVTDDLKLLLDELRIANLHSLISVSMGGVTALNFAIKHPNRLSKLIASDFQPSSSALNTQAWKERTAIAEEDGGLGIKKLAEMTVARWFHPASMEHKDVVQGMTEIVAKNSVEGFRYGNTVLWDYNLEETMPGCVIPTLMVVGEGDGRGALAKRLDAVKDKLGPNGSELRIVPNAGHLPMYEQPTLFWEAIRDFL